jgi:oxalate decarboxylase
MSSSATGSKEELNPKLDALIRPIAFSLLLTGLAGFVDAIGLLHLNHLYVSFMSGNSTHFGLALAQVSIAEVLWIAFFISSFVAGAALGTWVIDRSQTAPSLSALYAEASIFLIAILLERYLSFASCLLAITVAMGLQNALHRTILGADIGRSFVTGALFNLGQSIARISRSPREIYTAALNAASWLAFICGAVLGSHALAAFGLGDSLILGLALLTALAASLRLGWI